MGAPAAVEGDGHKVTQEDHHANRKGSQNLPRAHSGPRRQSCTSRLFSLELQADIGLQQIQD